MILFLFAIIITLTGSVLGSEAPCDSCNAYYEYLQWDTEINDGEWKMKTRVRIHVLNPRGNDIAWLTLEESGFTRLKNVNAEIFDANGKKVYEREKEDMYKECGFGDSYTLYQDVCRYGIKFSPPGYPYTIDYEYEKESNHIFFWPTAVMQRKYPVNDAEYKLKIPKDFVFHYSLRGLNIEPTVQVSDEHKKYTWSASDIPAFESEPFSPPEHFSPIHLDFSPENFTFGDAECTGWSWREIGQWYNQLANDQYLSSDSCKKIEIVDSSSLSVANAVYRYVLDNTSYVSIQVGVGGFRPHAASWTQEHGYGDCKDLSTLLVSYMRNHGIEAYPALIATRGHRKIDSTFPTTGFNHLITMTIVEGDTIWLDPTCDLCPFGELPFGDENLPALVMTDTGGILLRTPPSSVSDNSKNRHAKLHINDDLSARFQLDISFTGNQAIQMRSYIRGCDSEELTEYAKNWLPKEIGDFEVSSVDFQEVENPDIPLKVSITALTHRSLPRFGNTLYVSPLLFSLRSTIDEIDFDTRTIPIDLQDRSESHSELAITWDLSLNVDSIVAPPDSSLDCSFANWHRTTITNDTTVIVSYYNAYSNNLVPVDKFAEFQEYLEDWRETNNSRVKFSLYE